MIGYLIQRLLDAGGFVLRDGHHAVPVHLSPGGPNRAMPASGPLQYLKWIGQLLHGNLGFSANLNQSVASLIA